MDRALHDPSRRQLLGWAAGASALAALPATPAAAQAPGGVVTVLYRRESPQAPSRTEPVIQAATMALEKEFIERGYRVVQPTAEIYSLLEQGQGVVLTFAEDAGYSLVFSAYADMRPVPGREAGIGEVRLAARVFVGRNILAAEEGRGMQETRLEPAVREFGTRRAFEVAARKSAADLAEKTHGQLASLSPQRLAELLGPKPAAAATAQVVVLPGPLAPPGLPGGSAPAVSAPPALPSAAPAPKPAAPPPPAPAPPAPPPPAPPAPTPQAPAVIAPPAPAPAAPPVPAELGPVRNRHALVIGMADYAPMRSALNFPIGDLPGVAKDTQHVLNSIGKLGFQSDRVTTLSNKDATGAAVRGAIKSLAGRIGEQDLVLIYIAGHGADKDQSLTGFGMPILADFRPGDPNTLDYWELQSFVKNLRGRVVWVNDTCHSGGAATNVNSVVVSSRGVRAAPNVRGPDAQTVAVNAAPGQDFAILTACSPSELSLETAEGGLFTTKLFNDLVAARGKLPLQRIYSDSLSRHVIDTSRTLCRAAGDPCAKNPQQTPVMAFNGRGNLITV